MSKYVVFLGYFVPGLTENLPKSKLEKNKSKEISNFESVSL